MVIEEMHFTGNIFVDSLTFKMLFMVLSINNLFSNKIGFATVIISFLFSDNTN